MQKKTALSFVLAALILLNSSLIAKTNSGEPKASRIVVYKTIGDVNLTLHIFEPKRTDDKPVAAIVFFHGGGWQGGEPNQFCRHCQHLASRGMLAASAQYRLITKKTKNVSDCVADGKSAVRWLRQHAKELNIDPNRIAAGGGSAGGHIALCTALLAGFDEKNEDRNISSRPDALALFNPVVDTTTDNIKKLMNDPCGLSPAGHISSKLPPTIIFHGTADQIVAIDTVRLFCKKENQLGCKCQLVEFEGRPHSFFNYHKGGEDFKACLLKTDEFLTALGYLKAPQAAK